MLIENEKDLPGPRVKNGEVYSYHSCNRYEDSKTARNIGQYFLRFCYLHIGYKNDNYKPHHFLL